VRFLKRERELKGERSAKLRGKREEDGGERERKSRVDIETESRIAPLKSLGSSEGNRTETLNSRNPPVGIREEKRGGNSRFYSVLSVTSSFCQQRFCQN